MELYENWVLIKIIYSFKKKKNPKKRSTKIIFPFAFKLWLEQERPRWGPQTGHSLFRFPEIQISFQRQCWTKWRPQKMFWIVQIAMKAITPQKIVRKNQSVKLAGKLGIWRRIALQAINRNWLDDNLHTSSFAILCLIWARNFQRVTYWLNKSRRGFLENDIMITLCYQIHLCMNIQYLY